MEISSEEDTALRDLVSQTLDARGILPKIRAELRANVFLALEESPEVKDKLYNNNDLSAFAKTENGAIILNLIREFLEFFNLDFTLAVFNPESRNGIDFNTINRIDLLNRWNIVENSKRKAPVLCHVVDFQPNAQKDDVLASPLGLNSTYTKQGTSVETTPVRIEINNLQEQEEDISSNISENYSEDSAKTPQKQGSGPESLNSSSSTSTPVNEKNNESVNLLVFTPVQQVKTIPREKKEVDFNKKLKPTNNSAVELNSFKGNDSKDNSDKSSDGSSRSNEKQVTDLDISEGKGTIAKSLVSGLINDKSVDLTNGRKEPSRSSASSLKDLPPLMVFPTREKKKGKLRQLMGLDDSDDDLESSESSKEEKGSKNGDDRAPLSLESDKTINSEQVEEEEENISELLNSRGSSDGQMTNEETISRISGRSDIDYIENV